jgi:hypothetical protein
MEPTDETEPQEKTEFEKFQELGKHLFSLPKLDAETLKALDEAMAPPQGDVVITIESHDHSLIQELWALRSEDVEISETFQKSGLDPATIHIILNDPTLTLGAKVTAATVAARQLLNVVDRSLDIIERVRKITGAHTDDKNKQSKTKIRARKDVVPKLLAKYQDAADVEIEQAEDKHDPPQDI